PLVAPGVGDEYFAEGGLYNPLAAALDTNLGLSTIAGGQTFTVSISPNHDLYIAFRIEPTSTATLNFEIDALEFSQEPDHEWVELVNVSNEAVDIGGWELEVGIPDRGGDVP